MICPKCSYNQQYRNGMTCEKCRHTFIFNPKTDKMTDKRFLVRINTLNENQKVHYTINQLFSLIHKKSLPSPWTKFVGGIIMVLSSIALFFTLPTQSQGLIFALVFLVAGLIITVNSITNDGLSPQVFRGFLSRWKEREEMPFLVNKPALLMPPKAAEEPDIYDYGVEGILLVERDLMVDFFVLNGFHSRLKTIVISQTGYPSYIQKNVKDVLGKNKDLPVYLLHDGGADAGAMMSKFKNNLSLTEAPNFLDLGLFPQDENVAPFSKMKQKEGVFVDYLMPNQLINALSAAIQHNLTLSEVLRPAENDDDGMFFVGDFG